jgi:hypothetical protein
LFGWASTPNGGVDTFRRSMPKDYRKTTGECKDGYGLVITILSNK